jgi:hypothetical protein
MPSTIPIIPPATESIGGTWGEVSVTAPAFERPHCPSGARRDGATQRRFAAGRRVGPTRDCMSLASMRTAGAPGGRWTRTDNEAIRRVARLIG